jgi:hypothetical protein
MRNRQGFCGCALISLPNLPDGPDADRSRLSSQIYPNSFS